MQEKEDKNNWKMKVRKNMYRTKKTGILGIVITIVILILIVVFSNIEDNTTFFENIANKLIMPVQNGLTYLKNKVSGNSTFLQILVI